MLTTTQLQLMIDANIFDLEAAQVTTEQLRQEGDRASVLVAEVTERHLTNRLRILQRERINALVRLGKDPSK